MADPFIAKMRATSFCDSDSGGIPLATNVIEELRSSGEVSAGLQAIPAGLIGTMETAVKLEPGQLGLQS